MSKRSETADLQAVLRAAPGAIALITAIAVAIAVARQFGYFAWIDPDLLGFMNLEDVLSSSLFYVPLVIGAMLFGQFHRIFQFDPPPGSAKVVALLGNKNPGRAFRVNAVLVVLTVLFIPAWPYFLLLNFVLLYINVLEVLRDRGVFQKHPMVFDVVSVMAVLVLALLAGLAEGSTLPSKPDVKIATRTMVDQEVVFIRNTHDYLLVRLRTGEISAVAQSEVRSVTALVAEGDPRPPIPIIDWVVSAWNWGASIRESYISLHPSPEG